MDASRARAAPGVLAVITAPETKPVGKSNWNNAPLFGGSEVAHYHQAIACVVAETFEQARAAAAEADLILFVVDAREGTSAMDDEILAWRRKLSRP
uniref:hypothetical protein n=1 Tax=Escherichia coli TaxID=562 RepID=UPI0027D250AB